MTLSWTKLGGITSLGLALVTLAFYLRTGDPVLLVLGAVVVAMAWAFLALGRIVWLGLRRARD